MHGFEVGIGAFEKKPRNRGKRNSCGLYGPAQASSQFEVENCEAVKNHNKKLSGLIGKV